jgi:MYXO-CTERM domain-containing protein
VSANAADDLWLVPSGDGVVIAEYHAYDVMLHRLRPDGTLGGPVAIVDAGMPDAGAPDAGPADSGMPDSGVPDAGTPDAGTPDAGAPDAGTPDAGTPDDGGQGNPDGGIKKPIDDGCACSAGSGDPLLVAAALLMLGRVRRKRK